MKNMSLLMALPALILLSCDALRDSGLTDQNQHIRFNQVGYYPEGLKEFVVVDHDATSFMILDARGKTAFEARLVDKGMWEASGETVLVGNFQK